MKLDQLEIKEDKLALAGLIALNLLMLFFMLEQEAKIYLIPLLLVAMSLPCLALHVLITLAKDSGAKFEYNAYTSYSLLFGAVTTLLSLAAVLFMHHIAIGMVFFLSFTFSFFTWVFTKADYEWRDKESKTNK